MPRLRPDEVQDIAREASGLAFGVVFELAGAQSMNLSDHATLAALAVEQVVQRRQRRARPRDLRAIFAAMEGSLAQMNAVLDSQIQGELAS